ncbi:MAG: RNA degradosome polyphosphate kinase, partial [Blautia sp.]|nr:RNA degradosome polyphosphate kinase [Blautia sp.]
MDLREYIKPQYYCNRELSWMGFNERVLSEARDKSIPLFERLKFLSITASNLDEFFMIRVASLKDMVHAKYTKPDIAGLSPKEQLAQLAPATRNLIQTQYSTYNRSLLPALKKEGLIVVESHENMNKEQKAFADQYFEETIYPVLTPMAMDSARPFPLVRNKTLNIGALIAKKGKKETEELEFATVQVPSVLPRIVEIPCQKEGKKAIILLEEIIERNIGKLFLSNQVVCTCPYRIIRNADLTIDEDEAADLLSEIQKQIKKRQWGEVIRLDVDEKMDPRLLKILKTEFHMKEEDIYAVNGPLDLTFLMKMYGLEGFEELKTPSYTPAPVPQMMTEEDIF